MVAAILKSGLRIMPHSGGRVGSGVYLASENGKSAGYCTAQGHKGVMFLVEAALGEQRFITSDGAHMRMRTGSTARHMRMRTGSTATAHEAAHGCPWYSRA